MEGDKVVLHSSDLPYEYIYDDEKHVSHMPDSKLSVRNILDSAYASAEGKIIPRKLSRSIPPIKSNPIPGPAGFLDSTRIGSVST